MRTVKPRQLSFVSAEDAPNNPRLPVLLYRKVLPLQARGKAETFRAHFEENDWRGIWRDTIYTYRHFHTNAHEALGIARGNAVVELGGENGKKIKLQAGDLLILPAGTAHRRISGSKNFSVIGAYPKGQAKYDMCRDLCDCKNAPARITRTKLPESDPFYGVAGPLMMVWHGMKKKD
jgi:uncharacterized protein YjlB